MALTAYQTALQNLIQAPSSPVPFIPTSSLTTYINTARNQVAADAECIRSYGSLALSANVNSYSFSGITPVAGLGLSNVIAVRSAILLGVPIDIRPWEWYAQYYLGNEAVTGTPFKMAQQGQGAGGTLSVYPTPVSTMTMQLDSVWLPVPLVDDTTIEAIPEIWTDAVSFYAAWLAMQSLQRQTDAEMMFRRYQMLVMRGRQGATPSELPEYLPGGVGTKMASTHQTLAPAQGGGPR